MANKCSIASRIDCFLDQTSDVFGLRLKEQVEERLKFYETGDIPKKNVDVMKEASEENSAKVASSVSEVVSSVPEVVSGEGKKKKKKDKKRKLEPGDQNGTEEVTANGGTLVKVDDEQPAKKKKKSKKKGKEEVDA